MSHENLPQHVPLTFLAPATRPDGLGRLGHYEILQVLGQGGFGIVLRAYDEVLERVVAIKVLSPKLAATSPARKRFLCEAQAAAHVRHENLVLIHAVEEQPVPYLVMEFIPGETLQERLDRSGPFGAAEVVEIGRQIAEGLAAAHATGLIHRDIKPANILIESGPRLRVKITDFGLARAVDDASTTQSGAVMGTPQYMSPEQARGEKLDPRTDLFSLGSVLYAITSGRPPFRAGNALAILKRVAEDAPRPICEIVPETPTWLKRVISRLMAKNPSDRYPTAVAVIAALEAGPSADDTRDLAKARSASWARLIVLVGAPLLFAVLAVIVFWPKREEPRPNPVPDEPKPAPVALKTKSIAEMLADQDLEWSPPENLGHAVNGGSRHISASLTDDERILVYSRNQRLWTSRRAERSLPFVVAQPLREFADLAIDDASISGDGLLIGFAVIESDKCQNVWMSTRASVEEPFGAPVRLPAPVNTSSAERHVVLTSDGLMLMLTRSGTIYQFTRKTRSEPFGDGVVLPDQVNRPGWWNFACWLSADGLVLVRSRMLDKERKGFAAHVRPSLNVDFSPAQPLGGVLDRVLPDRVWLSPDGQRLYFHTAELPGLHGTKDLWLTRRAPKGRSGSG